MQRYPAFLALVASTALLGLFACGSDDEPGPTGPGTIGASDQETASALAFGVVRPLVQNVFLGDYIDQIQAGQPLPTLDQCQPLDICSSGSAMFCNSPGSLEVLFENCVVGNVAISGSLGLNVTDPLAGTGTLGITAGEFDISGTVSYIRSESCLGQGYELLTTTTDANDNELVISVVGFADHCTPYAMHGDTIVPSYAEFTFTISSLGRVVVVSLVSEGGEPGDMEIVVLNLARTEVLLVCHGNIFTGITSCG